MYLCYAIQRNPADAQLSASPILSTVHEAKSYSVCYQREEQSSITHLQTLYLQQ